jgi:hypothetical protein
MIFNYVILGFEKSLYVFFKLPLFCYKKLIKLPLFCYKLFIENRGKSLIINKKGDF